MAQYWLQNDVLKIVNQYEDGDEIIDELLNIRSFDDNGKPSEQNITNINFICSKDKIENMLEKIAKNNDGKITVTDGDNDYDTNTI